MKPQSIYIGLAKCLFALNLIFSHAACAADSSLAAADVIQTQGVQMPAPGEEQLVQVIQRTESSANPLEGVLVKNRYRQEPYEANYTVQVPYQTTETYYENIPYQTTETYYENVPYTEREAYTDYEQSCHQERQCRNVPRERCDYEQVCRSVPDRQCRQERLCRPVPGENRCEDVEECGTNALGQRICKTRKVCHSGPSREDCDYVERCENNSRQECHQERRCSTSYENECDYENVCNSVPVTRYREVTKYRQELRTRTVTKYRQEERTREVTKYRDEERCCVTKYKDVLDHQDMLRVVLQMPADATLLAGEVEKFQIKLIDLNGNLDVEFKVLSQITNYKVANKVIQGGIATLTLEQIPVVIDASLMGEKSVSGLRLKIMEDGTGVVVFKDDGQKGRTQTSYSISVKDNSGVDEGQMLVVANGSVDQKITLDQKLSLQKDHTVILTVNRQGPQLAAPISFTKSFKRAWN